MQKLPRHTIKHSLSFLTETKKAKERMMSKSIAFVLILVASIMLTGCDEPYCDSDYDCSIDEKCDGFFCKSIKKKKDKKCQEMTDCPSGYVCNNGRCK